MKRRIKVLYVTAEISPYKTVGGLGEVGKSFPKALANEKLDVRRVMPCYKNISEKLRYNKDFPVPMGDNYETCVLRTDSAQKEVPTYFIDNSKFFYRDGVYGHKDDALRYFFFCSAVVEMLKYISFKPDIIHINDWHTAFIPLLLKKDFPNIKTIYTVHNLHYTGFISGNFLSDLLSKKELFQLGAPGLLNFMKAGIIHSDRVTTVSPTYSREILMPIYGEGLNKLLGQRKEDVQGILNGIDIDSYNPLKDGVIKYPFDEKTLANKKKNKAELKNEFGLVDKDIPLIAMVTRLDVQKGLDLLLKTIPKLDGSKYQLIVLGSGNAYYQGLLTHLAKERQGYMTAEFNYSSDLAKKIYAASDIYLMPSQYEPCGIGQMYAMRYGAVPVVSPVGGLKDTVIDFDSSNKKANGFLIEEYTPGGLINALKRAFASYDTPQWEMIMKNCMQRDFSWTAPAAEYIKLYKELMNGVL